MPFDAMLVLWIVFSGKRSHASLREESKKNGKTVLGGKCVEPFLPRSYAADVFLEPHLGHFNVKKLLKPQLKHFLPMLSPHFIINVNGFWLVDRFSGFDGFA